MMQIPDLIPLGPNRVWRGYLGGRTLDVLEGKPNPADSHFPEDWIGSTTRAINKGREQAADEGLSQAVIDGREWRLADLFRECPDETLGAAHCRKHGPRTAFLLKFLDSAIRLPLQCHPSIPFAREHLNSDCGKTEAYVILSTREEVVHPYIYLGFQHPPRPEAFRSAVVGQRIGELLGCFEKMPVKAGDVFLVPGGLPHAIGEGIFMIEIMEPTDFVVRVEFACGGFVAPEESRFMGRDVDFAMAMFDFRRLTIEDLRQQFFGQPRLIRQHNPDSVEVSLIDEPLTRCFSVRRLTVKGGMEKAEDGFYIAIVTRGEGWLAGREARHFARFGDRFLVPAKAASIRYESEKGMEVTLALPPR